MAKIVLVFLFSTLFLSSGPVRTEADHWPEPFAYLNGTAPREPEFAPGVECATQLDARNQMSFWILRKDGVIVRVVQVSLGGRLVLTIYPLPGGAEQK